MTLMDAMHSVFAALPLDEFLGQRSTLWTRGADGARIPRSGLVREATCIGADGGLTRYRLCLVPWTWLLTQGRHSRVLQDRTVLQSAETVFNDYAPLATWQVGEEVRMGIRVHRSDATERSDSIQALGTVHGIESTSLTLLSYDYKAGIHHASAPLGNGETAASSMLPVAPADEGQLLTFDDTRSTDAGAWP